MHTDILIFSGLMPNMIYFLYVHFFLNPFRGNVCLMESYSGLALKNCIHWNGCLLLNDVTANLVNPLRGKGTLKNYILANAR